ncbi:phytanoyl-CoA dioxygenase family protein [Collimonas humicola]|uniref:phytanoyl-CoA dioxygenase family protein n=1 Tax=Collimonas humicola TaxID=2825886 RepID=UPI001E46B103|nr:phytanoyl-CoA dioxygenase family protein [Collimonas humicola]
MNTTPSGDIPFYGVLKRDISATMIEKAVEEIRNLGFTVVPSGFSDAELKIISERFDLLRLEYAKKFGESYLENIDEHNTLRLPLAFDSCFLDLAANSNVIEIISKLIVGKFILNQQNGIINPAGKIYNQGAWHRDLPYQHFVSSTPLAINALFCVDEFNLNNGATHVLPASHRQESFPSDAYIIKNEVQVKAAAGSFILIDCMAFHRGGRNLSEKNRRAVNHVYTIPLMKQQIDIPAILSNMDFDAKVKDLLGFKYKVPQSIEAFLLSRELTGL